MERTNELLIHMHTKLLVMTGKRIVSIIPRRNYWMIFVSPDVIDAVDHLQEKNSHFFDQQQLTQGRLVELRLNIPLDIK